MATSLYQKVLNVMQDVELIEKRGFNDFHNYKYTEESPFVRIQAGTAGTERAARWRIGGDGQSAGTNRRCVPAGAFG